MTPWNLRRRIRDGAETAVRRLWMRYALRGVARADNHARLDLAYLVPDPWKLDSEVEHARFRMTSKYLEAHLGRPRTILEIGCGEGIQSEYFARQCDRLTGIDVSARAIERAKKRLPRADFVAGDLFDQPWVGETDRFDVIVACEVVYYMKDVPRFLATISRLGAGCLVTYFGPAERRVGEYFVDLPQMSRDVLREADREWHVITWRGARDAR